MEVRYTMSEIIELLNSHDLIRTEEELQKDKIYENPEVSPDPQSQLEDLETCSHIFYNNKVWSKTTSKYLIPKFVKKRTISTRGPKPTKSLCDGAGGWYVIYKDYESKSMKRYYLKGKQDNGINGISSQISL